MRREQRAMIVEDLQKYQTKINEKFAAYDFAANMNDP